MALPTPGDRAAETSTTTGTGTYTLAGAITGWRTLVAACGDGAEVDYFVRDQAGGANYEVGRGTITDAGSDTLSRDTIYSSSNADAAVNWTAGTREIVVTFTANAFEKLAGTVRRNVVINGDFQIWPEGTTFTAPTTGDYNSAQWKYDFSGAGVVDVDKITASLPTVVESGRLITAAIEVDVTTIDATIAAGDFYLASTLVEGYNFLPIAQRPTVLSFWHKHTKTGTYCVALRNSGSDRSYIAEYTQTTTNTWERTEIPILASPSAGTWGYTTGVGVNVSFTIAAGSTFQTTADAWQTGNFVGTSSQVNGMDSATNFFRIAGVQLEAGTVASEFEQLPYAVVEAMTGRYFQILPGAGFSGFANATTEIIVATSLNTEMRANPVVVLLDDTPGIAHAATTQTGASSTISSSVLTSKGIRVKITGFTGRDCKTVVLRI